MSTPPPRKLVLLFVATTPLLLGGECQNQGGLSHQILAGTWSITRGAVSVSFSWTIADGGLVKQDSITQALESVDPADFPEILRPLAEQWNTALSDLNAKLDAALPATVEVGFPQLAVMRLSDPDDPTRVASGIINASDEFLFIGDLSGTGEGGDEGGGAALQAATITGKFSRESLTVAGDISRTLLVILAGPNQNGVAFTATVSVAFTGQQMSMASP